LKINNTVGKGEFGPLRPCSDCVAGALIELLGEEEIFSAITAIEES